MGFGVHMYFRTLVNMGRMEFFVSEWVRIIKTYSGHIKTSVIGQETHQKIGSGMVPMLFT